MAKFFDEIPDWLIPWILKQKLFWVASAPLSGDGVVNISPKGMVDTFHIVDSQKVWYEDLTGSGIETVANVRENGRITVMFNAFEGPPRITRLFGRATAYEFGTPEYEALIPIEKRQVGSRAIIVIDVHKVSTSCGYSIPFFTYKCERNRLINHNLGKEVADIAAENNLDMSSCSEPPAPQTGLKSYWLVTNGRSLNGLSGLETAYNSLTAFLPSQRVKEDKETEDLIRVEDVKLVAAFLTGVVLTASYLKFLRPSA